MEIIGLRHGALSGAGKGPIPVREKGGEGDTKYGMVTTIPCMSDSPSEVRFKKRLDAQRETRG